MTFIEGEYLTRDELCVALGPPGKPLCRRTIARYETLPDGLPFSVVGGRKLYRIEAVRKWLATREQFPNPRRRVAA